MEIKTFIAIFATAEAAIHFANCIAKEFSYLIKGNSIHVNGKKVSNVNRPLFAVDGERLSSIANQSGSLQRVCY